MAKQIVMDTGGERRGGFIGCDPNRVKPPEQFERGGPGDATISRGPSLDRIRYRRHDASVFLFAFDLIALDGDDSGASRSRPQGNAGLAVEARRARAASQRA